MTQLSIKEFRKLSQKEQNMRYKELSNHDKFLARISSPISVEITQKNINDTLNKLIQIERKKFENGEIDMIDIELLREQAKEIDKDNLNI